MPDLSAAFALAKHNLARKTGSRGSTGDTRQSASAFKDLVLVADGTPASIDRVPGVPLERPGTPGTPYASQGVTRTGDSFFEPFELVSETVTTGTRGTPENDTSRTNLRIIARGAPEFARAMKAALDRGPFEFMEETRWRHFVVDAPKLLADWSEQAAALGWQPRDFYGFCQEGIWSRYDCFGLAYRLHGASVVALDERYTRLLIRTGVYQSFERLRELA